MTVHRAANPHRTRLWPGLVGVVGAAAVVTGAALVVVGLHAQESAPRPPRSVGVVDPGTPYVATTGSTGRTHAAASTTRPLGPSRPTRIRIPAIGVDSMVDPIGLAEDGSLAVPQPGPALDQAAWFRNSPTPGQPGPAIVEGHVDSATGPSVFFRLGDIRPGDRITVDRADGRQLTFTVNAVRDYDKTDFPTRVVYGGDLTRPQLRLITCSDFDAAISHHTGNEVVFSHLTHISRKPTS